MPTEDNNSASKPASEPLSQNAEETRGTVRLSNAELQALVKEQGERLDRVVQSTNEAIAGITSTMRELVDAIHQPASIRRVMEAQEQSLGREEDMDLSGMIKPELMDVDSPRFKQKAELLQFMQEKVEVYIHETAEEDAEHVFGISVGGRSVLFRRGEKKVVPRYIVEGLARAKPVHYRNQEFTGSDGVRAVRYPSSKGLRYAFSVTHDPNPRGADWLKGVLAEP